jgi:hypothetical protein
MARHLNKPISDMGRFLVLEWFTKNGYTIDEEGVLTVPYELRFSEAYPRRTPNEQMEEQGYPDNINFLERRCLLHISTKQHTIEETEKVTGLNVDLVQSLGPKALALGLDDVLCVFVDSRAKLVMGQFLSELMKPTTFGGKSWPIDRITHQGKVYYFNFYKLPTLFVMPDDFVEQIGHMAAQNRSDKNQLYLY